MRRNDNFLSSPAVDALPVADRDIIYWDRDLTGFGVRVYRTGSKVYLVQGRGPDGPRRAALGRHGVISAEEARRRGEDVLARIRAGEAPTTSSPPT